ncbi:MAG: isoprenoid biosynthesis glyoxalase ElbB [Sumerlaeia bacterium]
MAGPKVGVVLSGCGFLDGAEITEAVLTIYFLDREGAELHFFAPDIPQMHVVNHLKGEPAEGETRNVLAESARIARGRISDVKTADPDALDALVLPGGYGAAKNLCDFGVNGPDCGIDEDVASLIRAMHERGKPLGFMCIAPAVAAKALGNGVELTIGNDAGTAQGIEKLGAKHRDRPVTEICVDKAQRVVSAPAYMYGEARPSEVGAGIEKLVLKIVEMAKAKAGV